MALYVARTVAPAYCVKYTGPVVPMHATVHPREQVKVQMKFAYGVELLMEHAANYTAHGQDEKARPGIHHEHICIYIYTYTPI